MFLLLFAFLATLRTAFCYNEEVPAVQSFVSRPDILAPKLDVRIYEPEAVAPGYIFLSTWGDEEAQNAPYIYDSSGELIYSGYNPSLPTTKYFNFEAHHLNNRTSLLSVFRGHSEKGRGKGHVALLDDSYTVVRTIEAPEHFHSLDFHEFRLLDDATTAIVVALQPRQADLSRYGIDEGIAWLLDSCFLKIGVESGEVLFEWCAEKFVGLEESVLPPSRRRAAGMSFGNAFDYFHVNSVDVFDNGDYLISARHTDTLYRIGSNNGSIKWRLGGNNSSFRLIGFNFSAQHDARIISENLHDNKTLITLFNNAFNGKFATAETSSALIIELDHTTMTAHLVQQYFPLEQGLSQNQGSIQILPNTNHTLVSWGMIAEFTEFSPTGERVLDISFEDAATRAYRVRKTDWVGRPNTKPDLYLYSRNLERSHFWMSWNGATKVKKWRIWGEEGNLLGEVEKMGFETYFVSDGFVRRGFVEAVDGDGVVIGRSEMREIVVPTEGLRERCGEMHCVLQILPAREGAGVEELNDEVRTIDVSWAWEAMVLQYVFVFVLGLIVGRSRLVTSRSNLR